jgi:hypothetical protein
VQNVYKTFTLARVHTNWTMPRAGFLCGALALIVALHSQSGFGLDNLLVEHTRSRARKSPSPSHPHPKCFIQVSLGATRLLSITVDPGFLASQVFDSDISHWANSSSQVPVCTMEPGTPTDVGIVVSRSFCPRRALSLPLLMLPTSTTTA